MIKFGALGDVIRTSFILSGLKKKYDNAALYWLTSNASFDLLRFNPYIFGLCTPTLNIEALCKIPFDIVISLDDEIEILELMGKLKFKEIIGAYLDSYGNPAYTDTSSIWFDMGLMSKYGKKRADKIKQENRLSHREIMEKMLGIKIDKPVFFNSEIVEDSKKPLFLPGFFNVGLNSGSGERWPSKELQISETIKLVNMLLRVTFRGRPVRIFLLGAENEIERHKKIKEAVKSPDLIDTGWNNSLLEFAAIIKHLDYVISSDSFALHLAIAQKKQTLSFYSPSPPWEIDTFGTGEKVISTLEDFCSFRKDADNSSITAERLFPSMMNHINNSGKIAI